MTNLTAQPTPTRGVGFRRRVGSIVLVLAVLAAGGAIMNYVPDRSVTRRPFIRTGTIGSVIDVRSFDVTVLGLRGAAQLVKDDAVHDTQGVWVIVRLRLTAHTEPVAVEYAVMRDGSGRLFHATDRISQPLVDGLRTLQPGIAVEGEVAFEVPADAADELVVRIGVSRIRVELQRDVVAEVPLPVNNVAVWLADRAPTTVGAPEVVS